MHRVVVLASQGVLPFELSIATRLFGSALDENGEPLYEVITCSPDGHPVRTAADFTITVTHDASVLATADTIVIPAAEHHANITGPEQLPEDLAAAVALVPPAARIVAICLASYVLAAAGLLEGCRATTHWKRTEHFIASYPAIEVEVDVLYVQSGRIFTSAGAAAGIDLCLQLIRIDHGSRVANDVARRCVIPPWRDGGQAQYVERPVPHSDDSSTSGTRTFALRHLQRPLPVAELAEHAGMSRRTFTRRFRAEVGQSVGEWLTRQRIELARALLETTTLPIDQVAEQAGFGSAFTLRDHFRASLGTSPSQYRNSFHE
ncbi:AraC family transcriptional regulator [Arthrobacter sp. MYb224]|uniref:GlxA family transcriptional regulator n=1 Tax=Micrococcaceae TaxID=1268 RepID=UPI000CFA9562|nr:helix-turn-helix domain-containing protein [Arthrobacter sp. MYb224]PQZ99700.1 AraC family transcriptional regulator [Arthrobacter sp. MYb224]